MIRALPALLLLAACAANDPLPRADNPAEAECRREAQNAPGAKDAFQRLQIQNPTARERVLAEAAAAERGAYLRCMRAKGLAAPGGVEPVRRPQ
ncbi:phosphoribosylamine--glycine ligase [Muricoccus pecuniae]|uniref:Phosphoribosylamine--glycine ligase n=1 Tax=Muricoccus pecuniae TaxID=693023 RepID=A0A840YDV8_9PROT|nr:phosphoribosylamine--glycine ligase [Roseomonas pecuniae]MBB5694341.1 hypothetical protein [Roseomonas pecuniae]